MSFTPELFMDVGATGALFTLRQTYLHKWYERGEGPMGGAVVNGVYQGTVHTEVRSRHVQNLGQDPAEAHANAVGLAAELGYRLTTTLDDVLGDKLRKIHRRTEEDIRREHAARMQAAAATADWNMMLALRRVPLDAIEHPKHAGKKIAEVGRIDRSFLEWLAGGGEKRVPLWELRRLMVESFLQRNEAPKALNEHMGRQGDRIELRGKVLTTKLFEGDRDAWPPRPSRLLVKMLTDDGHICTAWCSGRFRPDAGDEFHIKGTVKDHNYFRGQAETVLTRVAEL